MATRTSRINTLRGFCREFGLVVPQGARTGVEAMSRALADPNSAIPLLIPESMKLLVEEIRLLELRVAQLERELTALAPAKPGLYGTADSSRHWSAETATAMVAATGGSVAHFKDARHFASWFGLTPKEFSSGNSRKLGRISKKGDRYLRMLLTHGARAVLQAAELARRAGKPLDGLRTWATEIQARAHHNKAACALANKLARVCYAVLRDHTPFGCPQPRQEKRLTRTAFAIAV